MNRRKRLTIGVDFGTTYSGVAYSNLSDETNEPLIIDDWGSGPQSEKVPTVIRYNVTDHLGRAFGYKWGHQVLHHERRQEWFKLALDPMTYKAEGTVDMSRSYANELAEPPDYSREATTLVTDYLTALRKRTMVVLKERYGDHIINQARIDWVITTPAVWSLRAKDDTLRCAERAGMGGDHAITLVSEPEAAAAYAIKMMEPLLLKVNDNIVICDAGGGTVDLITYRILSLSPLEVEESAIPNGGKCGGVFVNRIFEKRLKSRLGTNSGLSEFNQHQLLNNFETYVKRQFSDSGDSTEKFFLPAGGAKNNPAAKISGGNMLVDAEELKNAFDPVLSEVVKLVKLQISGIKGTGNNQNVRAVLLVGGFGQSRYLKKKVEEAISPIPLLCPPHGWSAIARGAVIKGIAARSSNPGWSVHARKAQAHYGVAIFTKFIPNKHDLSRKFFDPLEGYDMCDDVMQWFVNRGEDVKESEEREYSFYRTIVVGKSLKIEEDLLCSLDSSESGPMYRETATCFSLARMKVDLTPLRDRLEKRRGANGQQYYHIDYEILATFYSADVRYKWRYKGEIFDTVKARYTQQ